MDYNPTEPVESRAVETTIERMRAVSFGEFEQGMIATKTTKLNTKTKARLKKLGNRYWRLNHLYYILDQEGMRILFEMNVVQRLLYFALWWLNIIPKSRQHGITTFIAIFMLDACLFNSNMRCGIIAHKLADAKKIFRDKIRYAYENLPADLKAAVSLVKDDAQELIWRNNSGIYVGTSMRSGTLQMLHVSEYAWTCTHAPLKAAEIKAGAMETIHEKGMIFIESTFEGPMGDFPEMCKEAEQIRQRGRELGPLDYKIHFFNWMQKESNVTDPRFVEISPEMNVYFGKLEDIYSKTITPGQRAWYVAKKKTLKHLMLKEHPSTLEEASIAAVEGAYYAAEMAQMREEGRICCVRHVKDYPVHTVCDLGLGGHMPWIFFQVIGLEVHIINCFALSDKSDIRGGAVFYREMLDKMKEKHGYIYGKHFAPFDMVKGEIGTGEAVYQTFARNGINFVKLEQEDYVLDGIERMTNLYPRLWIDSELCQDLIIAWSSYHREWIDKLDRYSDGPHPDKSSHYADAGRYLSKVIESGMYRSSNMSKERWRQLKAEYA